MKNALLFSLAAAFLLCAPPTSIARTGDPEISRLKLVTHLPRELPQRIMGLAYDGEKLWATIYHGRGTYATLNPSTLTWALDNESQHFKVIRSVAGEFGSPGGICFDKGKLWISGAYGGSFGAIDTQSWKIEQVFKGKQRLDDASQFYSSIACDGNNLWIAWHWFRYDLPTSQTQLLLKVDPQTGKVIAEYAAPGGARADGTHALTWDGAKLWHMKGNKLSAIDPSTGEVTTSYVLEGIKRPSGLAWADGTLWIAEFEGKVWRLPVEGEVSAR